MLYTEYQYVWPIWSLFGTKYTRIVELSLDSSRTPLQIQLLELNLGVGAVPNRHLVKLLLLNLALEVGSEVELWNCINPAPPLVYFVIDLHPAPLQFILNKVKIVWLSDEAEAAPYIPVRRDRCHWKEDGSALWMQPIF